MGWKDVLGWSERFPQPMLALVLATVAFTTYTGVRTFTQDSELRDLGMVSRMEMMSLRANVIELSRVTAELQGMISRPKQPLPPSELGTKLVHMEAAQTHLERRLKALEDALVVSPTTALAVPLFRKDLDTVREHMQANELANREREQRSADNMKLMFTLVAGVLTAVLGQWVGSRLKHAAK